MVYNLHSELLWLANMNDRDLLYQTLIAAAEAHRQGNLNTAKTLVAIAAKIYSEAGPEKAEWFSERRSARKSDPESDPRAGALATSKSEPDPSELVGDWCRVNLPLRTS